MHSSKLLISMPRPTYFTCYLPPAGLPPVVTTIRIAPSPPVSNNMSDLLD